MFFWDVGMLGCWCSFHDFVGSVFGSVFGRMIIGAGVDFFWWSTPWFRFEGRSTSKIGLFWFFEWLSFSRFSSSKKTHVSRLLLWPMTIMMMRSCIEHHWTLTGVDHVAPCSHAPSQKELDLIWWRQEHRKKELEKKARSRLAPWTEFRFEDAMFSSQMQGKECRSSWFGAPIYMDGTVLMAAIRDICVQLKPSLRRQLQLARGPWSTHNSLLLVVQLCVFWIKVQL